jgi:hypothetical protein
MSKGSTHRQKQLDRLTAHLAKQGIQYDAAEKERRRLSAASASMGIPGTAATSIQRFGIENTPTMPKEEVIAYLSSLKEQGLPTHYIRSVGGEMVCVLCDKQATQQHVESGRHLLAVESQMLACALSGETDTLRRRSSKSGGYEGPATKSALMRYWGDAIENVVNYYMQRLRSEKKMRLQGRHAFHDLDHSEITAIRLAFVSYKQMSGKYCPDTRLVYWDELDDDEAITKELGKDPLVPQPGQGWWPVVTARPIESVRPQMPWQLRTATMVCCLYQLMESPLASWPWSEPEAEP